MIGFAVYDPTVEIQWVFFFMGLGLVSAVVG